MYKIEITADTLAELAGKAMSLAAKLNTGTATKGSLLNSVAHPIGDVHVSEDADISPAALETVEVEVEVAEEAAVNPTPEEPASSGQTEASAPPTEEKPSASAELDFDLDVAPVVLRAVAAKGKPFVQDILSEFGSVRASQLDAALWPELITRLEAEIA